MNVLSLQDVTPSRDIQNLNLPQPIIINSRIHLIDGVNVEFTLHNNDGILAESVRIIGTEVLNNFSQSELNDFIENLQEAANEDSLLGIEFDITKFGQFAENSTDNFINDPVSNGKIRSFSSDTLDVFTKKK
jgi:hypothetical protein